MFLRQEYSSHYLSLPSKRFSSCLNKAVSFPVYDFNKSHFSQLSFAPKNRKFVVIAWKCDCNRKLLYYPQKHRQINLIPRISLPKFEKISQKIFISTKKSTFTKTHVVHEKFTSQSLLIILFHNSIHPNHFFFLNAYNVEMKIRGIVADTPIAVYVIKTFLYKYIRTPRVINPQLAYTHNIILYIAMQKNKRFITPCSIKIFYAKSSLGWL